MSQIYRSTSSGPSPPNVPTDFEIDEGGPVVPNLNVLEIVARDNVVNIDDGIRTANIPGAPYFDPSNRIAIELTNRTTATATQIGVGPDTLLSLTFTTDGTYYVYGNVQGYSTNVVGGPASIAISFTGGFRMAAGVLIELGTEYHDTFQEAAISAADIVLTTSGASAILQVTGIAVTTIFWNGLMEYRQVN